jgi:hypothetical protein
MLRRTNRSDRIDNYKPDPEFLYLVEEFWHLKMYAGDLETPLQRHHMSDTLLDRNERAIMLAMDRAFRPALSAERAKNDKHLASKRK